MTSTLNLMPSLYFNHKIDKTGGNKFKETKMRQMEEFKKKFKTVTEKIIFLVVFF